MSNLSIQENKLKIENFGSSNENGSPSDVRNIGSASTFVTILGKITHFAQKHRNWRLYAKLTPPNKRSPDAFNAAYYIAKRPDSICPTKIRQVDK